MNWDAVPCAEAPAGGLVYYAPLLTRCPLSNLLGAVIARPAPDSSLYNTSGGRSVAGKSMTFQLRRKKWRIKRGMPVSTRAWAECDDPRCDEPEIVIRPQARGQMLIELVVHELLHAHAWRLPESTVHAYAAQVARLLHRAGFRQVHAGF